MKQIKLIFILLFFFTGKIYSIDIETEFYNLGYGNIANNLVPQYAVNNSAVLNESIDKYFTVGMKKPLQLYSFNISFPFLNNKNGLLFIKNYNDRLNLYGLGIGVIKFNIINVGSMFSFAHSNNNYSISFSPQFLIDIADNFVFGLNLNNIISTGELYDYNIISGLGIYLDFIRFFPGVSYANKTLNWSIGMDINLDIIGIQIGVGKNDILLGINFNIKNNYIFELSSKINFDNKNSDYTLSYSQRILLFDKKSTKRKIRRRVSSRILNKQKKLIESGLDVYKKKDYESAYKIWNRAYRLAPSTKYGREAKKYLIRVKNILRQINQ